MSEPVDEQRVRQLRRQELLARLELAAELARTSQDDASRERAAVASRRIVAQLEAEQLL